MKEWDKGLGTGYETLRLLRVAFCVVSHGVWSARFVSALSYRALSATSFLLSRELAPANSVLSRPTIPIPCFSLAFRSPFLVCHWFIRVPQPPTPDGLCLFFSGRLETLAQPPLKNNKTTVEGQPVYAHKVLCMRCTYFRAMLTGEMKESRAKTITLPDVRRPIFLALLEYLYTDEVSS